MASLSEGNLSRNIIFIDELESTNEYAISYLSKIKPLQNIAIWTDYQSGGKGQIGRSWDSERSKNLLVSYILHHHNVEVHDQFYLNIATSLAVMAVLRRYGLSSSIKWPNDIYIGQKKIAGILIQNTIRNQSINASIIGIGLNVNQEIFPSSLPNPTSMVNELLVNFDRLEIFNLIWQQLDKYMFDIYSKEWMKLSNLYKKNLFRYDEFTTYYNEKLGVFEAKITNVCHDGHLELLSRDGKILKFSFREITFLHS